MYSLTLNSPYPGINALREQFSRSSISVQSALEPTRKMSDMEPSIRSITALLQVRCPVRILHGSKDSLVPPKVSEELMQWLETPDVHLTMIKDGDHRLSRPQDLRTLLLMVSQ